ncbi:AraC family transcriptional regulator [Pectobacterium actinidiae]|uniref:AraC family transcriptional regulator n=1 Tax=Pectobacterium actinidiae TaxID=1507808 RepID=A0A1V2R265_9GAMM|nr:helix-turn-helix domain-containing protein [Pectobacterium actinidiae]KHN89347.1 AraC family transcriptional regulator [Pectobacterium actinidiae]MDY4316628.1 helix-turn-helix domain-containing protein [Pectobacterium actinidiae]ONK03073.1 AraC family transcriptional regulator [Pectobacterium actinidiae]ONK04821.1 AraC family transcriptional regulator [Pectobacterium actinidiae]
MVTPQVKFVLLLMPGFSLLSVGGFLDKLRFSGDEEDYSRQLNCTWKLTALDNQPVTASCGAVLVPDEAVSVRQLHAGKCDYFVIFGGNMPEKIMSDTAPYLPLLRHLRRHHIPLVSVDNAAFLLAETGFSGKRILVHWRHFSEFKALFPSIAPVTDKNVMEEGHVYSCPGGSATIELAAFLLEKKLGRERAIKGLSDMLVGGFAPPSSLTWNSPELEDSPMSVRRALIIMRQSLASRLSSEDIAQRSGLSRRQLDRSLQKSIGRTIQQAYMEMKIAQACWLMLRTSRTLSQIAVDTGFSDPSHLSRIFQQHLGLAPGEWRRLNAFEMQKPATS